MRKGVLAAACAAAALAHAGQASATVISLNKTIDLSLPFVPGASVWQTGSAGEPDAWSPTLDFTPRPAIRCSSRRCSFPTNR
jgi:hypothetical protein